MTKALEDTGAGATRGSAATVPLDQLRPGDRIHVEHQVVVGRKRWSVATSGTVVRTERRRHGLHFRRNLDDKVFSDLVVLQRPDGELTTVTLDEFTVIRRD